jgi:hypothetical protein
VFRLQTLAAHSVLYAELERNERPLTRSALLDPDKQIRERDIQRVSDPSNNCQTRISMPALDSRNVRGVQLRSVHELLLREFRRASELLNAPAKCLL